MQLSCISNMDEFVLYKDEYWCLNSLSGRMFFRLQQRLMPPDTACDVLAVDECRAG